MPMSRRLCSLAIAAVLLVGCADTVTKANFDRLQPGMTREQVEAILGPPHQTYQGGILSWSGCHQQRVITVVLDDRGQVANISADGLD
jgi:hypothetical protein